MAANLLIYPLDYPPTIVGPSELELRVAELEAKMESVSILGLQDRRDGGNDAIDLELRDTTINVYHSAIPRFGFKDRNQGTKGLMLGGETDGSLTGRIAKFDYLFETPSLIGADIGIARHSGVGTSAVAAGYLSGGNTATNITSKIEKLGFDTESVFLLAAQLQVPLSELAGFATTADSLTFGGLDGTSNTIVAQIRALKHSTESVSLLSATLGTPKTNQTVVGTTSFGLIVGGKRAIGSSVYATTIDKMTWITQLVTPSSLSLSTGLAFSVGVGNDYSGYIVGGRTGAVNSTAISRIANTTESISPIGISLSAPRADAVAVGSSRIGYLLAGGVDPTGEFRSLATVESISRLTFVGADNPLERIEPLSFNLPYGAVGAAGISDYSPGTYSSNSVSIVNLYDGIYSKLGHVHDERYPLQSDVYYRAEVRQKLSADLVLYVDVLNTVPAATGLGTSGNPFETIDEAIATARTYDYNNHSLKIKIANGIYPESVRFDGELFVGLSPAGILLEGNVGNPAAVVISIGAATDGVAINGVGAMNLTVKGVRLTSSRVLTNPDFSNSIALSARSGCQLSYSDVIFAGGFVYHIQVGENSRAILAGNAKITHGCTNHIRVSAQGIWETALAVCTIDITTPVVMDSVLQCSYSALIAFYGDATIGRYLRFTGSAVTGHSLTIDEDGQIYHFGLAGFDKDTTDWSFISGTLGARNLSKKVGIYGNSYISGVKNFANPIGVPEGVALTDAVNLGQLLSRSVMPGGFRLYFPNTGLQIIWGQTAVTGDWQASGTVIQYVYFNQVVGFTGFTYIPTVVTSVDRLVLIKTSPSTYGFEFEGDSPGGNVSQPADGIINWIALGY